MKQSLQYYLTELLATQDCVILPMLGAFVMSVKPAFWDKDEHTIAPFTKNLVFNKNLQYEDGLLGHYIAKQNDTSYEAAMEWVRWQIKQILQQLNQGENYVLDQLGVLFKKENTIVFIKDKNWSFPCESFGLNALRIVKKASVDTTNTQPLTTTLKKTNTTMTKKNNPGPRWGIIFAIIILLLGGALLFYFFKKEMSKPKVTRVEYPSLDIPEEADDFEEDIDEKEEQESGSQWSSTTKETDKNGDYAIEQPAPKTHYTATTETTQAKFFLIAGVYKVEKNAQNMVKFLKSSGFSRAAILAKHNNNYRVTFDSTGYNTLHEAEQAKEKFEEMGYSNWVLKQGK